MFGVLANIDEDVVRLFNLAQSESCETDLDQRSVVQNLVIDWLYADYL